MKKQMGNPGKDGKSEHQSGKAGNGSSSHSNSGSQSGKGSGKSKHSGRSKKGTTKTSTEVNDGE